jgi:hypothetical protein
MYDDVIETKKDADNGIELFLQNTIPKNIADDLEEKRL